MAFLFALAAACAGLFCRRPEGYWLPNAWFPLTGRWLKYLLVSIPLWVIILLRFQVGPVTGWSLLGLWLSILLMAALWRAHAQPVPPRGDA